MATMLRALALFLGLSMAVPVSAQEAAAPDVATQWRELLAHGTAESVNIASAAIDAVDYSGDGVDGDKCRSHEGALKEAIRQLPVSMMVQRVAMLCAQATGDQAAADRASAALAALAKDAFAQASRGAWAKPVRVVLPGDALALLASAGMTVRYELFEQIRPRPYFPWRIAAVPAGGGQEKLVTFDYVDTMQILDRRSRAYGTPRLRMVYAESTVKGLADLGVTGAIDNLAIVAASQSATVAEKVRALRTAAAQGGLQSIYLWMLVCKSGDTPNCTDGLIDALLPLAEARQGYPMVLLATAYAQGIGVKADQTAAEAMLDAADRVMEGHRAASVFADTYSTLGADSPFPDFLRRRLLVARDAGNEVAGIQLIANDMQAKDDAYVLSADDERRLADPANNGLGKGLAVLALWYRERDQGKYEDYLQRAADAGDADSLSTLAFRQRGNQGTEPLPPAAEALFERSANGGDPYAMRYLAYLAMVAGKWERAEDWILLAAVDNDVNAMFLLAGLWAGGHEGMSGTPERANAILENLAENKKYGARARRMLANNAVQGRGMAKDLERARRWLEQDADAGDAESQADLGMGYLSGRFGRADEAKGRKWMERAVAANLTSAFTAYGYWLLNEANGAGDSAYGLKLMRRAADEDDETGLNNLAWELCVSRNPQVHNPEEGLAYSRKLEKHPNLDPSVIDTVAACEAAAGHFERAIELQRRVVEFIGKRPESDRDSLAEMQARLALYQAGKPYLKEDATPDAP